MAAVLARALDGLHTFSRTLHIPTLCYLDRVFLVFRYSVNSYPYATMRLSTLYCFSYCAYATRMPSTWDLSVQLYVFSRHKRKVGAKRYRNVER